MSGTLLAFATFWVGYLSRPFGESCLAIWAIGTGAASCSSSLWR
jgi:hypothetical protein